MDVGDTVEALRPEAAPDEFIAWARAKPADATIAIVGHEPHLSTLTAWLLTGNASAFIELKKGGACLLQFEHAPRKAGGTLLWLMRPSQLDVRG
jgi:phosphohistidine phosphatase